MYSSCRLNSQRKMTMQRKLMILAVTATFMEVTMAATYTVGSPNGGWDTSTDLKTWASAQSFSVGDNLMFQYMSNHNVLEVSKADYDSCQTSNPIQSDSSGSTTIPLSSPGKRYFICGTLGHCGQGMKVEVDTLATSAPPPASPSTPPPATPATPPPGSSPSPPAASPLSPPVASLSPEASPPSPISAPTMSPPQSESPMSSPPPSLSVPSSESPASSPPPSGLISPPPPSSAHKCSFQATLATGVGFVVVFLVL